MINVLDKYEQQGYDLVNGDTGGPISSWVLEEGVLKTVGPVTMGTSNWSALSPYPQITNTIDLSDEIEPETYLGARWTGRISRHSDISYIRFGDHYMYNPDQFPEEQSLLVADGDWFLVDSGLQSINYGNPVWDVESVFPNISVSIYSQTPAVSLEIEAELEVSISPYVPPIPTRRYSAHWAYGAWSLSTPAPEYGCEYDFELLNIAAVSTRLEIYSWETNTTNSQGDCVDEVSFDLPPLRTLSLSPSEYNFGMGTDPWGSGSIVPTFGEYVTNTIHPRDEFGVLRITAEAETSLGTFPAVLVAVLPGGSG